MQSSSIDFEVILFKKALDEEPTAANGWELAIDGLVNKAPDCPIKVYKKKGESDSLVTCRLEATLKNINIDKLYKLMTDFDLMSKSESKRKNLILVEKISKNSDIIYTELDFPFPLTNRDFLIKRLYLSNKDDAELIRQLGLYTQENKYFVLFQKSTQRSEYPEKSKPIRAETKLGCWLVQEDPSQPNTVRIKNVGCHDMKGNISSLTSKAAPQGMQNSVGDILSNYRKLIGKE